MGFSDAEAKTAAGGNAFSTSEQHAETAPTNESTDHDEIKPKTHFSLLGAIGVQYSLTSAPLAIGFYLSMVIGLGGSPAYFWGFIVMGFFQLFVCLAICELASAIPHSAGSFLYHYPLAMYLGLTSHHQVLRTGLSFSPVPSTSAHLVT